MKLPPMIEDDFPKEVNVLLTDLNPLQQFGNPLLLRHSWLTTARLP